MASKKKKQPEIIQMTLACFYAVFGIVAGIGCVGGFFYATYLFTMFAIEVIIGV